MGVCVAPVPHWYGETEGLEDDDGSTEVSVAAMEHNLIEEQTKPVVTYTIRMMDLGQAILYIQTHRKYIYIYIYH